MKWKPSFYHFTLKSYFSYYFLQDPLFIILMPDSNIPWKFLQKLFPTLKSYGDSKMTLYLFGKAIALQKKIKKIIHKKILWTPGHKPTSGNWVSFLGSDYLTALKLFCLLFSSMAVSQVHLSETSGLCLPTSSYLSRKPLLAFLFPSTYKASVKKISFIQHLCIHLKMMLRHAVGSLVIIWGSTGREGLPEDCRGAWREITIWRKKSHHDTKQKNQPTSLK